MATKIKKIEPEKNIDLENCLKDLQNRVEAGELSNLIWMGTIKGGGVTYAYTQNDVIQSIGLLDAVKSVFLRKLHGVWIKNGAQLD